MKGEKLTEPVVKKRETTTRVKTQGPLMETARERTQAPSKAEATKWKKERWRHKKKKKRKKKKVKHRKRRWWKKFNEIIISLFMMRMKKGEKEKESRRRARRPKARETSGKFGKWLLLFLILGQNWQRRSRRTTKNGGGDKKFNKKC